LRQVISQGVVPERAPVVKVASWNSLHSIFGEAEASFFRWFFLFAKGRPSFGASITSELFAVFFSGSIAAVLFFAAAPQYVPS
jgi:hypothetical protein